MNIFSHNTVSDEKRVGQWLLSGVAISFLLFSFFSITCWTTYCAAKEMAELSNREKAALVQQGLTQYRSGEHAQAQKTLEHARMIWPENDTVPYYLGLIYLESDRRADAIGQWRRYVQMNPESEDALKIRKYLTVLIRREAVEYAKEVVAHEAALTGAAIADNAVAVMAYRNLGTEKLGPLGKGLAAMLIHDLSQVPGLQVVERIKLQALLQELALGASDLIKPDTTSRVGKLLKSRHVTTGSIAEPGREELQIASVVMDAKKNAPIATQDTHGTIAEFYRLEKRLACEIIEDLGRSCDNTPAAFKKFHTKSLEAMTAYSIGLEYLDQEEYDLARLQFQKAILSDPGFQLAREALLDTPLAAMSQMSSDQMLLSLSTDENHTWRTIYLAMINRAKQPRPGLAYTPPEDQVLQEAVSLALMTNQEDRAGQLLIMAMEEGYPPYLVLRTIYSAGGDPKFNQLCKQATDAGVTEAIIAKAALDARDPLDQPVFSRDKITQSQCLKGLYGLPFTAEGGELEVIPLDTEGTETFASPFVP